MDVRQIASDVSLLIKEVVKTLHRVTQGKHHPFAKHYLKLLLLGQQGLPGSTHTQHNCSPVSSASNAQITSHQHAPPSLCAGHKGLPNSHTKDAGTVDAC